MQQINLIWTFDQTFSYFDANKRKSGRRSTLREKLSGLIKSWTKLLVPARHQKHHKIETFLCKLFLSDPPVKRVRHCHTPDWMSDQVKLNYYCWCFLAIGCLNTLCNCEKCQKTFILLYSLKSYFLRLKMCFEIIIWFIICESILYCRI